MASYSAIHDPVMEAVRVPPSACSTSQSTVIWRSPMRGNSVTARRERPIRRWISWVRPDCLPAAASRRVRSEVARGSMPYSAVTQPLPPPFSHGGTGSPTVAVQSTWVSPKRTRQEPSAWRDTPRSRLIGRMTSAARLDGRILSPLEPREAAHPRGGLARKQREAQASSLWTIGGGANGLACPPGSKRLPPLTMAEAETGAEAERAEGAVAGAGGGSRSEEFAAATP